MLQDEQKLASKGVRVGIQTEVSPTQVEHSMFPMKQPLAISPPFYFSFFFWIMENGTKWVPRTWGPFLIPHSLPPRSNLLPDPTDYTP